MWGNLFKHNMTIKYFTIIKSTKIKSNGIIVKNSFFIIYQIVKQY